MMFFGLIMAEKRKNTTKMVFLLQMCVVVITGMRIGVIPAILVIFCAYFYFESRKIVEIG